MPPRISFRRRSYNFFLYILLAAPTREKCPCDAVDRTSCNTQRVCLRSRMSWVRTLQTQPLQRNISQLGLCFFCFFCFKKCGVACARMYIHVFARARHGPDPYAWAIVLVSARLRAQLNIACSYRYTCTYIAPPWRRRSTPIVDVASTCAAHATAGWRRAQSQTAAATGHDAQAQAQSSGRWYPPRQWRQMHRPHAGRHGHRQRLQLRRQKRIRMVGGPQRVESSPLTAVEQGPSLQLQSCPYNYQGCIQR